MTVHPDPDQYKPTGRMKGVWLFLVSGTRYVEAAIEHGAWVNLQAADLRASYLEGNFVPDALEFQSEEKKRFKSMRRRLCISLGQTLLLISLVLLVGWWIGMVHPKHPWHLAHAMVFCGTSLIAWSALFAQGGPEARPYGKTLSEIIHPVISKILLLSGTSFVLCSIML